MLNHMRQIRILGMPKWKFKAIVQGGISKLPKAQQWNHFFQKYITKDVLLNVDTFENKLKRCRKHLENYLNNRPSARIPFTVFELGTGWYPIIPLGLYLSGASEIWSFDKNPNLSTQYVKETLSWFVKYAESGILFELLP